MQYSKVFKKFITLVSEHTVFSHYSEISTTLCQTHIGLTVTLEPSVILNAEATAWVGV